MDEVKIVERLTETEARSKSNQHQIEEVKQQLHDLSALTASVEKLASNQTHMDTDLKEIKADVKALADKPAKKWDGLMDKILWALLGGLIAYAMATLGLQ